MSKKPSRSSWPSTIGKDYITYAVVVSDGAEHFIFLSIARSAKGDVHVNIFHNQQDLEWENWKPHTSYHASYNHHQKSFNRSAFVSQRQEADTGFANTDNIVTMLIPVDEPRRLNNLGNIAEFDYCFEIRSRKISTNTYISVDLAAPNGDAIVTPGATIIQEICFRDRIPWILITVFEPKGEKHV